MGALEEGLTLCLKLGRNWKLIFFLRMVRIVSVGL